jgi:hypothetical protein
LQPDPLDPERFQRLVVGGGTEATVADHRPGRPTGERDDPLDRQDQLRRIRRVALWQLVIGDQPAFLLGQQQGRHRVALRLVMILLSRQRWPRWRSPNCWAAM